MIMGTCAETSGYVTAEAHKTQKEGMSRMTWGDLVEVKPETVREETAEAILRWLGKVAEEEAARPANQAVARLHDQTKSRGTPPRVHIWED